MAALIGGCRQSGEAGGGAEPAAAGGFPVTVQAANGPVLVRREPRRIVSLSPTATEMLFAVGAGDHVVAVDDQSDHPSSAPRTELSAYEPNLEAIARHRPDLVIVSDTSPAEAVDGLRRLGAAVLVEPSAHDLDDAYDQIVDIGIATGRREGARRVVDGMRSRLEAAFASAPSAEGLSVYHELEPDLFSASSSTFIGGIYARLGVRNVADRAARRSGAEYPQLSAEEVVSADPDLIVLADTKCCNVTPERVARRPGFDEVAAVRDDGVIAVDDDVAARWGPRLPLFVERVVRALRHVASRSRAR